MIKSFPFPEFIIDFGNPLLDTHKLLLFSVDLDQSMEGSKCVSRPTQVLEWMLLIFQIFLHAY